MAVDFSTYRVELRRHIGYVVNSFGLMPVEHDQKIVLLHIPDPLPGVAPLRHVGYLPDREGAALLPLPDLWEEMSPALRKHVSAEAERLKQAGEFSDPPAL